MVIKTVGLVVGAVAGAVAAVVAVRKTVECRKLYVDRTKLYACLHDMQVASVEAQDTIDNQAAEFEQKLDYEKRMALSRGIDKGRLEAADRLKEMSGNVSNKVEALSRLGNENKDLLAQVEKLNDELNISDQARDALIDKANKLQAEVETLRADRDILEDKVKNAHNVNKALTDELLELRDCWKADKYKVLAEVEKLRQECAADAPPAAQA